ncbi:MAG: winged helix-turn-helix transcriptional regulator [Spirochaetales bacterium]|nr:winged helix-turn-helix transcriptional regulator [Spirochaetales bacterium]
MDKQCCDKNKITEASQKLKVCGHPIRLKILCLIEHNNSCVSELWQCLDLPQPVISQHLAVLKDKNIVSSKVDGNKRIYSITDEFIRNIVISLESSLEKK